MNLLTDESESCLCCGYPALDQREHSRICVLCDWIHGYDSMLNATGKRYSLDEAQKNFKKHLTCRRPEDQAAFKLETNPEVLTAKHKLIELCEQWTAEDEAASKAQLWQEIRKLKGRLRSVKEIEDAFDWPDDQAVILALAHLAEEKCQRPGSGYEALSQSETIAVHINLFDAEVANGGFHQFFTNSSGDDVLDVLQSLKAIGAQDTARLLEKALSIFLEAKPSEDEPTRIDQSEEVDEPANELLYSLDQEYYSQKENIFSLAAHYLKDHKSDFQWS